MPPARAPKELCVWVGVSIYEYTEKTVQEDRRTEESAVLNQHGWADRVDRRECKEKKHQTDHHCKIAQEILSSKVKVLFVAFVAFSPIFEIDQIYIILIHRL